MKYDEELSREADEKLAYKSSQKTVRLLLETNQKLD